MREDAGRVPRHKTAVTRIQYSRPIRLALEDGIISEGTSVFDYGCGRGDDIRRLQQRGIPCSGWDPAFRPETTRSPAHVVNIGYVVNVIEDRDERSAALQAAWDLAKSVLVVAARTTYEATGQTGRPHGDGFVTQLGTFQRFYDQQDLRTWIDTTLGVGSVPAGPGVFYVFRDAAQREAFLASRYRRSSSSPRVRKSDLEFEQHKELFEPLIRFFSERGRLPEEAELDVGPKIREHLGGLKRAFAVVRRITDVKLWEAIRTERSQDLLVYIALSRFGTRPRLSELPRDLQLDIRAFFGTYKRACELSDALLFSAGDRALLDSACRSSRAGKTTPAALYVHVSALDLLDPVLRVYEGCARTYVGQVHEANVVKLHRDEPAISYLCYPDFERDPHPSLAWSLHVPLQTFHVHRRDYVQSSNPPILHRKEDFVGPSHPLREKFAHLTEQEEKHGLFADPNRIGTREQWTEVLRTARVTLRGHRLVKHVSTLSPEKCAPEP